jgi:hypothetical protein
MNKRTLYLLTSIGYNLVIIKDEIFIINSFTPAENNINKHIIFGIDITELIDQFSQYKEINTEQQKQEVITKINNLKVVKREFSKDFSWQTFLSY